MTLVMVFCFILKNRTFKNLNKFYLRMQKCVGYTMEALAPSVSIEDIFNDSDKDNIKIDKIEISSKDELAISNNTNFNVELHSQVVMGKCCCF